MASFKPGMTVYKGDKQFSSNQAVYVTPGTKGRVTAVSDGVVFVVYNGKNNVFGYDEDTAHEYLRVDGLRAAIERNRSV